MLSVVSVVTMEEDVDRHMGPSGSKPVTIEISGTKYLRVDNGEDTEASSDKRKDCDFEDGEWKVVNNGRCILW